VIYKVVAYDSELDQVFDGVDAFDDEDRAEFLASVWARMFPEDIVTIIEKPDDSFKLITVEYYTSASAGYPGYVNDRWGLMPLDFAEAIGRGWADRFPDDVVMLIEVDA
jgi:hypothetical protein